MNAHNPAGEWLRMVVDANRTGHAVGLFSVCSAHPAVLRAAMRQALNNDTMLAVESTCNQVNQFGGYTGLTPSDFVAYLHSIAREIGFDPKNILIGSDHLGPYPWRGEASQVAMEKASALARDCALAGYVKIHLDASMPCADDAKILDYETIAARAAQLCSVVESTRTDRENSFAPVYVIGTEVPVPGGEHQAGSAPLVTTVDHIQRTLESFQRSFFERGLQAAWERVIGLVVQSGAEFTDAQVFDYDPQKTGELREHLPESPSLVYEAHSTDYQTARALKRMVEDHFAILKVGPWLTFAYREAVFALSEIEHDWLGARSSLRLSSVRDNLDAAMLRNPVHWQNYFGDQDTATQAYSRLFSFSDRCRYYWTDAAVQRELNLLLHNLASGSIPLALISQHFPAQYEEIRTEHLNRTPEKLIEQHVVRVLNTYFNACNTSRRYEG